MRWDLEKEMETFDFPPQDKMIEELQTKNLGYDFQKGKHSITKRTPLVKLKQYYIADKLSRNLGDISKVGKLPYADLVTYSFCCQDLSVAGKGEGMKLNCDECGHSWLVDFEHPEKNNSCPNCGNTNIASTRSGLLGQVQRLLGIAKENHTLPKYLLLENVKNLVGKKFIGQFEAWVKWLDSIGYNTYWKIINSKHMGVPQNRERVFAISIRKDVDIKGFIFPETIPLTTCLKDVLEKNVLEKYYLPDERMEKILNSAFMKNKQNKSEPQIIKVGQASSEGSQSGTVYSPEGIAPALIAGCHGYAMGNILEEQNPFIVASRGRNSESPSDRTAGIPTEQRLEPNFSGCTNTLTSVQKDNYVCEPIVVEDFYQNRNPRTYVDAAPTIRSERNGLKVAKGEIEYPCSTRGKQVASAIRASIYKQGARNLEENVVNGLGYEGVIEQEISKIKWRIRKLTPKECTRLMNFTDKDYEAMVKYVSNSAIYKADGNSIVVACLIAIMSSLFIEDGYKAEVWTKYILNYDD